MIEEEQLEFDFDEPDESDLIEILERYDANYDYVYNEPEALE